ncbi:MAG: chemotaxis protein CheW [endosymbiont of Galathealinum brachiosum]|uniref:Chemotaxis protein CheW n=1 Tax=endosymbiont of Galathealinum brachiosum TaxID=2200906 RepID=A0A370DIL3_9GAMM|nr:MAG: chemotaxis protein CheW [endosymbiont of Galathealinum brachiosum]
MSETAEDLGNGEPVKEFKELLTFFLAGEEYGVDILRVQEIKGWDSVTNIPNTPEYIRGVINIRGAIVPIIDMRLRFMLEKKEYDATTVVIILSVVSKGNADRVMGVVVDAVSDVYNVPANDVKASPDFGTAVDTEFVTGLATIDEKMIIVLDIDHMLNAAELAVVDTLTE